MSASSARRRVPATPSDHDLLHSVELETREHPKYHQPGRSYQHPLSRAVMPGLFPRRSVNLVFGSGGVGKTTTVLAELDRYLATGQFLTHRLPEGDVPTGAGAIICSGTFQATYDRIQALDLDMLADLSRFPIHKWEPETADASAYDTLAKHHDLMCRTTGQHVGLLLIEGFQLMMADGQINNYKLVSDFYKPVQEFCLDRDVTILGTAGSPKAKVGDRYPALADRILGSTAWAQEASTLIAIEGVRTDLAEEARPQNRKLVVQVRETASLEVLYTSLASDGRLVVIPRADLGQDAEVTVDQTLDGRLAALDPGTALDMKELLEYAAGHDLSKRSIERWLSSRIDLGMLERTGNNRNRQYVKVRVQ